MTVLAQEKLPYLSSEERLQAYQLIVDGCHHLWSKNKKVEDRVQKVLETLTPLAFKDPYFLAHLTSYIINKKQSKDLQVLTTYVSALSSADGKPFSPGSKYLKPNLRYIANAALHQLDPKLALRVAQLANSKFSVANYLNMSSHFPTTLRTGLEKYIRYREVNPQVLRGIRKAGLASTMKNLYRAARIAPTDEAAAILKWAQRGKTIKFEIPVSFDGLSDLEIAQKIQTEKLGMFMVIGALGNVNKKITPVIAVALLEQLTGNQAVVLKSTFDEAGVLTDPEVMKLFKEKIATAQTALDRVENLSKKASEEVAKVMKEARSEKRKETTTDIGRIYMHLDFSGSMDSILRFAIERGAIIAECVNNPTENFRWGLFGTYGEELALPDEFVADAFAARLFGKTTMGSTDAFALYPQARQFGADVDVFVTDQGHNMGDLGKRIRDFHSVYPELPKPKACVIVHFNDVWGAHIIREAYEENGIPVSEIKPETLTETALVVDSVKTAMLGPVAVVDEIMETELLKLPDYYYII